LNKAAYIPVTFLSTWGLTTMYKSLHLAASLLFVFSPLHVMADQPTTIGWIEHVAVQPHNLTIKAKIDTGADNSSIHAKDIQIYEKAGGKWVRFLVENDSGETAQFDLQLLRIANIKRKGAEPQKRPVVNMDLCIGNTLKAVDINLANRENFKYRMLIGRSYLKDQYLVDSGRKYTAEPACVGLNLAQDES
jgi:hypothetical protein